ncbi:hypothetical protein [Caballeronia fortuita]|uniref:hypothetical protein n=1 Tax=Caballeronia fortuita TaxID=1777138 RepID=UPI0007723A1C|nr:hypothetical protein [Caballeronia fortuita]
MSTVAYRHALVACLVVCACAIVCGCGKPASATSSSVDATSAAPSATGVTSELQDWAKQATGDASDQILIARPVMARAASEPLATPVIHTAD